MGIADAARVARGERVTVERIKRGRRNLIYPMQVVSDDGDRVAVQGPFSEPVPRQLGYVTFELTDHFVEYFWRHRWYTIAAVTDADGAPKGWYCDVARPASVTATRIESVDLELDVWIPATCDPALLLDEDEFAELGLASTDPDASTAARQAANELMQLDRRWLEELAEAT